MKAICVIGNFMEVVPNDAALNAVKSLINCGVELGHLTPTYTLGGHRNAVATTECPGFYYFTTVLFYFKKKRLNFLLAKYSLG